MLGPLTANVLAKCRTSRKATLEFRCKGPLQMWVSCRGTGWNNSREGHEGQFLMLSLGSPKHLLPFLGERAPYTWVALTEARLVLRLCPFCLHCPAGLLCPCGCYPTLTLPNLLLDPSLRARERTVPAPRPLAFRDPRLR